MPRTKPKPQMLREERAKARMDRGGRIAIPPKFRKKLGLKPGKDIVMTLDEDGLHVWSLRARTRRIQELFVDAAPPTGASHVDDFIAERRKEAARE